MSARKCCTTAQQIPEGVCAFVIDTTDRIQHIFWRFEDTGHPLYEKKGAQKYGGIIRDYYKRADRIIGEIMRGHVDDKTLLLVLSDHGFTTFRKGVNLNRWLIENSYMMLREEPDPEDKEGGALFRHVDWSKTAAYALGFSSIYLNLKGREGSGIVQPGSEAERWQERLPMTCNLLKTLLFGQRYQTDVCCRCPIQR